MNYEKIISLAYIAYIIIMSIIAMSLFIKDKSLAVNGKNRIKEKTLLGFTIYGGAIGAFISRIIAHHKTNKIYFSIIIYLSMLLELLVLGLAIYILAWR